MNSDEIALRGDWAGRHRRKVRALAVVCGVVGVAMNLIHEAGRRTFLSTLIGLGFLILAIYFWNAPSRLPRPGKYPDRFDKRAQGDPPQ